MTFLLGFIIGGVVFGWICWKIAAQAYFVLGYDACIDDTEKCDDGLRELANAPARYSHGIASQLPVPGIHYAGNLERGAA